MLSCVCPYRPIAPLATPRHLFLESRPNPRAACSLGPSLHSLIHRSGSLTTPPENLLSVTCPVAPKMLNPIANSQHSPYPSPGPGGCSLPPEPSALGGAPSPLHLPDLSPRQKPRLRLTPSAPSHPLFAGFKYTPHRNVLLAPQTPALPLSFPISVHGNSILLAAQNPDKNNSSLLSPSQFTGPPWTVLWAWKPHGHLLGPPLPWPPQAQLDPPHTMGQAPQPWLCPWSPCRDQEARAPEDSCLPHRPAQPSPQNLWSSPGGPSISLPPNTPILCSQDGV